MLKKKKKSGEKWPLHFFQGPWKICKLLLRSGSWNMFREIKIAVWCFSVHWTDAGLRCCFTFPLAEKFYLTSDLQMVSLLQLLLQQGTRTLLVFNAMFCTWELQKTLFYRPIRPGTLLWFPSNLRGNICISIWILNVPWWTGFFCLAISAFTLCELGQSPADPATPLRSTARKIIDE